MRITIEFIEHRRPPRIAAFILSAIKKLVKMKSRLL